MLISGPCQRRTMPSKARTSPASTRATSIRSARLFSALVAAFILEVVPLQQVGPSLSRSGCIFSQSALFFEIMQPDSQAACPTKRMGRLPGKEEEMEDKAGVLIPIFGMLIPIIAILSVFTFVPFAVWFGSRQNEREAFYKSETLRRITEASGEGAKAAIELLREDERLKRIKDREGMKVGGLVLTGVGLALVIFLGALSGPKIALCGLLPGLIGVALLIYVFYMAGPVE